jgi:hypothetical protein
MIRPQISNAVVLSVLFASLAGGAMLLILGGPAIHRAAAAVEKCDLDVRGFVFPARSD